VVVNGFDVTPGDAPAAAYDLSQLGMYAAPLGLIGYALFGGSRLLVFGAAESVAAVSASVASGLAPDNEGQAVAFTSALALAAGVVFLVAGLAPNGLDLELHGEGGNGRIRRLRFRCLTTSRQTGGDRQVA
jgi:Sulfate permease family